MQGASKGVLGVKFIQGLEFTLMTTMMDMLRTAAQSGQLRPLDVRKDLKHVADLVEQCFADTLDVDGQRYIQQMRSLARSPATLNWIGISDRFNFPLSGYVWEEDGRLVGNLTLIPYQIHGEQCLLIANVAVHPDYRRRGIAYRLTARALEHARQRGVQAVWLHVREENEAALQLYRALGFVERARRTTWLSNGRPSRTEKLTELETAEVEKLQVHIKPRRNQDWPAQQKWLRRTYPLEVTWHLSLKVAALQPGLKGFFYRFLNDLQTQQWSAWKARRLLGVLAWNGSNAYADNLWLATSQEDENVAAQALLTYARQQLSHRRPLSLDYPAGRACEAIQQAGFHVHQTLIWMSIAIRPQTR